MGSPAQSRSRAAQSMFSPLSVTREREKTDEGEAQTETEAPEGEAPESDFFVIRHQRRQREEGEGQSQPEEPREDRGGRCPDGSSGEAPESDFYFITRKRIQKEEGGSQSQPEEPRGDQTTRRDSGEVPEKEPQSRLSRRNQRKERPRAGPVQPRLYSPLSVTREGEKTEEGAAQKEAPERSRSRLGLVFQ